MQSSRKENETNLKPQFVKKQSGGESKFFKFDESDTFTGKFSRILPDDHHLEGIEFLAVNTETMKEGDLYILPSYYALMDYFKEVEPDESKLYQIVKVGEKEGKRGTIFLFDIYEAAI